jgi:hypothetical protein
MKKNSSHGIEPTDKYTRTKQLGLLLIASAALVSSTGCVTTPNGFSQFYEDMAGPGMTNLPPYSGTTKVFSASNPTNDVIDLYRNDYELIGVSAFTGPPQSDGALLSQAKKVGADVVLLSSAYLGSSQAAVPWIQYQPGQTYTTTSSGTVNASAWGSGGHAYGTGNYFGTSTTTTPGTFSTQAIPVTVHRYEYEAGFYRKGKPPILGVGVKPLPPELRQRLERNTGVVAWVVIAGSPAFAANILEGDALVKINGEDVVSIEDYGEKVAKFAGQKVELEIWRNEQSKTISVQLNNMP